MTSSQKLEKFRARKRLALARWQDDMRHHWYRKNFDPETEIILLEEEIVFLQAKLHAVKYVAIPEREAWQKRVASFALRYVSDPR